MSKRFDNKTLVVTGASAGIGKETCNKIMAQGGRVIALDLNEPDFTVDCFIQTNIADPLAIAAAAQAIDAPINGLLNIAGLPPREGNQRLLFAVNFFGLRQLTEALMPKLAANAAIINVASRAGAGWMQNIQEVKHLIAAPLDQDAQTYADNLGLDATRAYNLTKEAVIVWTMQQTAKGLPRGIRMNSISPGAVSTAILDDFLTAFAQASKAIEAAGRATEAHEVADLLCFLASEEAAWIKGTDVGIDGGIFARRMASMLELI